MSDETLECDRIGWYGKLPAAGDFLRHQLPDSFVDSWDAWLRAGMALTSGTRGEEWQDSFLRFPAWRFLRRMETRDEATVWSGLLVPSVDRVGRLFPLTVAFGTPAGRFAARDLDQLEQVLAAIEAATLALLGNDDLEGFAQAMAALERPPAAMDMEQARAAHPACLAGILGRQALADRLAGEAMFWAIHDEDAAGAAMLALPEPLQPESFGRLVPPLQTLMSE